MFATESSNKAQGKGCLFNTDCAPNSLPNSLKVEMMMKKASKIRSLISVI